MRLSLAAIGGALLALPLLSAAPAEACTLQIGSNYYEIEAVADHRPESEQHLCTDGILRWYGPKGYEAMTWDDPNKIVWVWGMGGTMTAWGAFLVVVLDDGRVVFRWGDTNSPKLMVNDSSHLTYFAQDGQGGEIHALGVHSVSTTPKGEMVIELEGESDHICSVKSDARGAFTWNWECRLTAAAEPPGVQANPNALPIAPPPPTVPAAPQATAVTPSAGGASAWKYDFGQGSVQIGTYPSPGNQFFLSCTTENRQGTFYTEIGGRPVTGRIQVSVDGQSFEFWMDSNSPGWANTNCHACNGNWDGLWYAMRAGRSMTIKPDNGQSLTLSLAGSADAMPQQACASQFWS